MTQFNNDSTAKGIEGYWESLPGSHLHIHIYGTNHWLDWVANFIAIPIIPIFNRKWPKTVLTHLGWYTLTKQVWPVISEIISETKPLKITLTGHSLGGGPCENLAIMITEELGIEVSLDLYGGVKGLLGGRRYFRKNGIGYWNMRLGWDIVPFLSPLAIAAGKYKHYDLPKDRKGTGKLFGRIFWDHQPVTYQKYSVWKL